MVQILEIIQGATQTFSLAEGLHLMKPLALFILGMAVYSIFIFKFYRYVARRDVFKTTHQRKDGTHKEGWAKLFCTCLLCFQTHIFLANNNFLLVHYFIHNFGFLSRQEGIQMVLLVSIALISTIRIMAYYNEDLSKDLAKMLPFALLGIFLVDITFFATESSLNVIREMPAVWNIIIYYLVFLILLEIIMRGLFELFKKLKTL